MSLVLDAIRFLLELVTSLVDDPRYRALGFVFSAFRLWRTVKRQGGLRSAYIAKVLPAMATLLILVLTLSGVVGGSAPGADRSVFVRS